MREKLELEGKFTILKEIEPKYFDYVIKWRNDPKLNQYIDQKFTLTYDLEMKWYQEKYLPDETQGFFVAIDKETGIPFGTVGYEYLQPDSDSVVCGRVMKGVSGYSKQIADAHFALSEYLHKSAKITYAHVVKDNSKALQFHHSIGFVENTESIRYPEELHVSGMELIELVRTEQQFIEARNYFMQRCNLIEE